LTLSGRAWHIRRRLAPESRGLLNVMGGEKESKPRNWDAEFTAFKEENPDATFAQYYASSAIRKINAGQAHSTLGAKLYKRGSDGEKDFWTAGQKAFERYKRISEIEPSKKVVDYGCGSLRLGIHFIQYLDRGHYFGLDVTNDFFQLGQQIIGEEILSEKQPSLSVIDEAGVERAAAFGADFVISNAVSYHVHPDETASYFRNLTILASKPGARLFFDVKISPKPLRFRERGWAWPLEVFVEGLPELRFVQRHGQSKRQDQRTNNELVELGVLEFRRES
jgi:SAM-dependent methyltransferase